MLKPGEKKIYITVDQTMHAQIKAQCALERRSLLSWINEALAAKAAGNPVVQLPGREQGVTMG